MSDTVIVISHIRAMWEKTMQREDEVLCKQALKNEFLLNLRGLEYDRGAVLAKKDRTCSSAQLQKKISNLQQARPAEGEENGYWRKQEGVSISNDIEQHEFMKFLSLHEDRVWMRGGKGVKINCKSSYRDLSCKQFILFYTFAQSKLRRPRRKFHTMTHL